VARSRLALTPVDISSSLRERAKQAQANMACIYEGAGHDFKIEQLCDRWQVSVQTGDLLRILDAAERLPEKGG